jgi:hypothetical protein
MQSAETVLDILRERGGEPVTSLHGKVTGEPGDRKRSRRVCAVRRVITSPAQPGDTRRRVRREARLSHPQYSWETLEEMCLGYQLTQGRKTDGTAACWNKARLLEDAVRQAVIARPTW